MVLPRLFNNNMSTIVFLRPSEIRLCTVLLPHGVDIKCCLLSVGLCFGVPTLLFDCIASVLLCKVF